VVIWLNGAFGVGKTSVARTIAARWSSSILFDPEEVGSLVQNVVPRPHQTADFQDMPLWRKLTLATAVGLIQEYTAPLLIPMTLCNPRYYDEIIGELRRKDVRVHHFTLLASPRTLIYRIRSRAADPSSTTWAEEQVGRCSEVLIGSSFATHIRTDSRSVAEVADEIVSRVSPG
jgi:hypothetical protein